MTPTPMPLFQFKKFVQVSEESASTIASSYLDMDSFDMYQRDAWSGLVALGGVCVSVVFSVICISFGIYFALRKHTIYEVALPPSWRNASFDAIPAVFSGVTVVLPTTDSTKTEILSLALNLVVTGCTESTGFVHSVALKSALAHEARLHCNTNLRLLTAARGNAWTNSNGTLSNAFMAILLIMSYVSSTLVFVPVQSVVTEDSLQQWWYTCTFALPLLTLGIALMLQVIIAMAGISQIRVLTWSSSPLDTTAALLHHGQLTRNPGRCMHNVVDSTSYIGPRPPSERQPSAWESHPSVKKIIIVLWCLVLGCGVWGGIVGIVWVKVITSALGPGLDSWSIFPNDRTNTVEWITDVNPVRGFPAAAWFIIFVLFIVIQGGITVGLHCSEVIANVVRDEMMWRRATSKIGTKPTKNPLLTILGSWPNVSLLIAKPVLHWMFGLSFAVQGYTDPMGKSLLRLSANMRTVQIIYLTIALFAFATVSTFVARRHPQGPQPAAYGHLQTLANLVDEWSPTMWWGLKADGKPICHAGTSNLPLPPVRMNTWYAGDVFGRA